MYCTYLGFNPSYSETKQDCLLGTCLLERVTLDSPALLHRPPAELTTTVYAYNLTVN